jgi:hypothetical protein
MYVKVLVNIGDQYEEHKAKLIGESEVIYTEGHQIKFVKVLPTAQKDVYVSASAHETLAENIHIIKDEDILDDIEVVLKQTSLFDFIRKIKQPSNEYNFELVDIGGYRVRKF